MVQIGLLGIFFVHWLIAARANVHQNPCEPNGGVRPSNATAIRSELDFLGSIACHDNSTVRNQFLSEIGVASVPRYYAHTTTFYDRYVACRSENFCSGFNRTRPHEITWCIHLYHPTEQIRICLDKDGIVNMTDYARMLHLQCYFDVPESCSEEDIGCINVKQPDYFLHNSVMTCSLQAESCSSIAYTLLEVEILSGEERPTVSIFNKTTPLILGQTNVYLCIVRYTSELHLTSVQWSVNNTQLRKIHEHPFLCPLEKNCNNDTLATTRNDRVRAYEIRIGRNECPFPIIEIYEWLWIENATEEDAELSYNCNTHYSVSNPFPFIEDRIESTPLELIPVIEVTVLELPPVHQNDGGSRPTLGLRKGETVRLTCAMIAGLEDTLVWLYNGNVLPTINTSTSSKDLGCPSNKTVYSLSVSDSIIEERGKFARGFNSTLIACNVSSSFAGHYQCFLNRSPGGSVEVWSADIHVTVPEPAIGLHIGMAVMAALLMVVVLALIFLCVKKCYIRRRRRRKNCSKNIIFGTNQLTFLSDVERELEKKKKRDEVRYDPLEFPREQLFLSGELLGEGTFGRVIQARAIGIVKDSPERNVVAIKTYRENAQRHEISDLQEELELMKTMEPHENLVNLLGYCPMRSGPLYLILEYAVHGSLKDYLQQCKEVLLKLNHIPHIASSRKHSHNSSCSFTSSSTYPLLHQEKVPLSQQNSVFSVSSQSSSTSAMTPSTPACLNHCNCKEFGSSMERRRHETCSSSSSYPYLTHDYVNSRGLLYMEDVQNFALQIACGLRHLEKLKVVHCDLAARNILIAEGFILKIGDFGMARDISDTQYYRKHIEGRIPVKWTAPEALQSLVFTSQNDIWSYGVVLWEIFTYAEKPYPDQKLGYCLDGFIKYLMDGNRLPLPKGCPSYFYDLMLSCWQLSPGQRPLAENLVRQLSGEDEVNSGTRNEVSLPESQHPPAAITPV